MGPPLANALLGIPTSTGGFCVLSCKNKLRLGLLTDAVPGNVAVNFSPKFNINLPDEYGDPVSIIDSHSVPRVCVTLITAERFIPTIVDGTIVKGPLNTIVRIGLNIFISLLPGPGKSPAIVMEESRGAMEITPVLFNCGSFAGRPGSFAIPKPSVILTAPVLFIVGFWPGLVIVKAVPGARPMDITPVFANVNSFSPVTEMPSLSKIFSIPVFLISGMFGSVLSIAIPRSCWTCVMEFSYIKTGNWAVPIFTNEPVTPNDKTPVFDIVGVVSDPSIRIPSPSFSD